MRWCRLRLSATLLHDMLLLLLELVHFPKLGAEENAHQEDFLQY